MADRFFARSVVYNGRIFAKGIQQVPDDLPLRANGRDLGVPVSAGYAEMPLSALIAEAHGQGLTITGSGPDEAITRADVLQVLGRGATPPPEPGGPLPTPAQVGMYPVVPMVDAPAGAPPPPPAPLPTPAPQAAPSPTPEPVQSATVAAPAAAPAEQQPNIQPPPQAASAGTPEPLPTRDWSRDALLAEAQRRGLSVQGTGSNGYVTKDDVIGVLGI